MKIKRSLAILAILTIGYFSYLLSFPKKDTKLKNLIISQLEKTNKNGIFDLAKFANFEWDKIFMVYSDSGVGKSELLQATGIKHYGIGDHKNRFYFVNKGKLVKFFDSVHFEDNCLWMYSCNREYQIEEVDFENAHFEVEKHKEGWENPNRNDSSVQIKKQRTHNSGYNDNSSHSVATACSRRRCRQSSFHSGDLYAMKFCCASSR